MKESIKDRKGNPWARMGLYLAGLTLLALGVVMNTKTNLGVSAINSVPYALSVLTGKSLGLTTIFVFSAYVGVQFLIRKEEKVPWLLLQVPFTLLFGQIVNLFNGLLQLEARSLGAGLLLLGVAIPVSALGIYLTIQAGIVPLSPDSLTDMLAKRQGKSFGFVKNIFDILSILLAVALSLAFAGGIIGIGWGTLASALLIGRVIVLFEKALQGHVAKLLYS
ncbi:DUF6198 family protein [Anaerotalea alkaliphila]|uniref:Membrane protein YczE n=1 Tax=Anaerotalea alkaliphila TaxID=2662126 RepID=A0A7X5HV08_9FIRM|nr:DUF6198 family protein [Anaerotalea alkaliphila]NDL66956.1 hypothetical protein [Anaerotalea alkaliphila]